MATTRRANGEGSRPKERADGSWAANYTDRAGRRRTVYGATAEECRAKLSDRIRERDTGAETALDRRTKVGPYALAWLDTRASVDPSTVHAYRNRVARDIVPALGRVRLVDLTAAEVGYMLADMRARGLSPATRRQSLTILRTILDAAMREGKLARNVARLVESPRADRGPAATVHPPTVADLRAFRAAARGDRYEALWVMLAHLGLRQGELLGLHWADIDLDAGTVHVAGQFQRHAKADRPPKSARGVRTLRLSAEIVRLLRAHRVAQLALGHAGREGYVFTGYTGRPIGHRRIHELFKAVLARADIHPTAGGRYAEFRMHDFRHAVATILLESGRSPAQVQAVMGHSSIATTVNLYGHHVPDVADANVMAEAIGE